VAAARPFGAARIKISGHESECHPTALPAGLASAAAALFVGSGGRAPAALTAAVQPGCTLLTLDGIVLHAAEVERDGALSWEESRCGVERPAGEGLRALLCAPGAAGAYFRARDTLRVAASGVVATARRGEVVASTTSAASMQHADARLPRLALLAASCDAPVRVHVRSSAQWRRVPPPAQLRCRLHGHFLALLQQRSGAADDEKDDSAAGVVTLAAAGEEGVALIECVRDGADDAGDADASLRAARPRPLLLCRDADVVAELNASAEAAGADGDDESGDDAATETAVVLLGHALRPGCSCALRAAAAAAALRRGWRAAAGRCMALLASGDGGASSADSSASAPERSLLHEAVASGSASAVVAVLSAGGAARRFGASGAAGAWPRRATLLHLAAAAGAADIAALLTRLDAGAPGGAAAGADGVVAWFAARDAAGATLSDVACAGGSAALASLDASLRRAMGAAAPMARAAAAAVSARLALQHWPHLAAAACDELAAAAAAHAGRDASHAAHAALAAALLRDACAAWERKQRCAEGIADADAAMIDSDAGGLITAFAAAAAAAREGAWLLELFAPRLEAFVALQSAYHVAQALRGSAPAAQVAAAIAALREGPPGQLVMHTPSTQACR
jgi:hypothetical protein